MKTLFLASLVTLMTVSTAACQQPVPPPEIKPNPRPQEQYELVMTVRNAPRAFQQVSGHAQFDIPSEDDACLPLDQTRALGGVRNRPSKELPVEFRRVSDSEYRAVFFADALLDEDYYGLGVCHWQLTAVGVNLTAPPAVFSTETWGDAIRTGAEQVTFSPKALFDQSPAPIAFHPMILAGDRTPGAEDFEIVFHSRKIDP